MRLAWCVLTLVVVLTSASTHGAEPEQYAALRLLDDAIFGKDSDTAITLLEKRDAIKLNPITVMVDIRDDIIYAATVQYERKLPLSAAIKSVEAAYAKKLKLAPFIKGD